MLAWQKLLIAMLASGDDQVNAINAMSNDSYWQTRLLALEGARQLLGTKALAVASQLSSDQDPAVRQYAIALSQSLQQTAATQPSETAQSPASTPVSTPDAMPVLTPDSTPESPVGNAKE